ncbi:MAG: ABC transporter permease subunit [Acidobacteriota bacterium]
MAKRLLRDAWLHFLTELRFGIRDPHILGYTLWMPLFLYPALIFTMLQILTVREGRSRSQRYTIGVPAAADLPAAPADGPSASEVLGRLRIARRLILVELPGVPRDPAEKEKLLRREGLDGVVTFLQDGDRLTAELSYRGVESTEGLVKRFEETLDRYRNWYEKKTLRLRGAEQPHMDVHYVNAASSAEMGVFIMARLLPVTLIVFLGTGAFYTSIDVTAGERERGTLETTLLLPASRTAIVLGKFAYVLTMAMVAALVNFLSLSLTMGHAFSLLGPGLKIDVSIPPLTALVLVGSLLVLGLAITPLMMGLAFLAKSFREGQSYVGPVYAILIAPIVIASLPGIRLTPALALVPMVNLTVGLREAVEGKTFSGPFAIALLETLVLAVLLVRAATRLLDREQVAAGDGLLASLRAGFSRERAAP